MKSPARLILLIFLAVFAVEAQNPAVSPTPPEECGLVRPDLVTLNVTAWSKNKGYLKGLTPENFEVFAEKNKREIEFFKQLDEPVSVGILFDLSGSSKNSAGISEIPLAVDGLISFINGSNPKNEYFIIAFAKESTVLLEPTQNKKEIEAALKILLTEKIEGNTGVYDAMDKGFEKISKSRFEKKVLLVISDGEDNNSNKGFGKINKLTREHSNVLIYQLNIVSSANELGSLEAMQSGSFFETLTETTGGRIFYPKNRGQAIIAFEMLAEELKNQYVIGFSAESAAREKNWREVKVNLNLPKEAKSDAGKVVLRAQKGFYF